MINKKYNISDFPVTRAKRTVSKTVRSNTESFTKKDPKALPEPFCVNMDWFSFMADFPNLPEPTLDKPAHSWDDGAVVVEWQGKSAGSFKYFHNVYVHGEHVAYLLSHGVNPKIIKPGKVKVEILNHVHYSNTTIDVYSQILNSTGMLFANITRLDISIDGSDRVHRFLNLFAKQDQDTAMIHKLGRARFASGMYERFMYNHFKIGAKHKCIVVYNKSREIREKSNKTYIEQVWAKNGMDYKAKDVWRTELRLNSQAVKEFKDLQIENLQDPKYLLQIFRTASETLMDFVIVDHDKNLSRCRRVDLFRFDLLHIDRLEKVPRHKIEGCYKAKMAIHNDIKDIIQGYMSEVEAELSLVNIHRMLQLYDLFSWYRRRLSGWLDRYKGIRYNPNYEKPLMLMAENEITDRDAINFVHIRP